MLKRQKKALFILIKYAFLLGFIFTMFTAGIFFLWFANLNIPPIETIHERQILQSTKIYDRTGEILLYDYHGDEKRTIVPLENISKNAQNAFIAIEDKHFYQHKGFVLKSFLKSAWDNLNSGKFVRGASTITQQVVKNTILTADKTISRKAREILMSFKLENILTKEEILGIYLNEIAFGGTIYGIQEASISFFEKNPSDLTLAESAYLAALPKAPTTLSPYGENFNLLEARKNLVLNLMLEQNLISPSEYKNAITEEVVFSQKENSSFIKAPHFVFYVLEELEKKYDSNELRNAGYKIITTLDYKLQEKIQERLTEYVFAQERGFKADNAAAVILDVKNGDILTMVGSRDYFDEEIDGKFNVTTSLRQPGSTFKPIAYTKALELGYLPETKVLNLETEFSSDFACNPDEEEREKYLKNLTPEEREEISCYSPGNYDGEFTGPVSLKNALAQSINIPAIKILYLVGVSEVLQKAKDLGITSLDKSPQHYGLNLVLGGGEVSPLEMGSVYSVFANGGYKNSPTAILKIENSQKEEIFSQTKNSVKVLDENVSAQINDMLSDREAKIPAYGTSSNLYFYERDVASKTGTTNDFRDVWTVGYDSQIVLSLWGGNNDNQPVEGGVAGGILTPLWRSLMDITLEDLPKTRFEKPKTEENYQNIKPILRGLWQGNFTYFINSISGKVATDQTPENLKIEVSVPDYHSILHWIDKKDPRGAVPENPDSDPQYKNWEYSIEKWLEEQNYNREKDLLENIDLNFDDSEEKNYLPAFTFRIPEEEEEFFSSEKILVRIREDRDNEYNIEKVFYYVNGEFIGSSKENTFSFFPINTKGVQKENILKAVAEDKFGSRYENSVRFFIKD